MPPSAQASSSMDVDADSAYLASALSSSSLPSSLRPLYSRFQSLHSKKLWYQLTLALEEFMAHPDSSKGKLRIELWDEFISKFASKLNQLRLVGIAVVVARQYQDISQALTFLQSVAEKVDTPSTQEALVFASMEAAHFKLLLGDLDGTKQAMDKASKTLDTFDAVERGVHASFYRVSGDFFKAKADYAPYYRNSLLYLACINIDTDLSQEERIQRAHDLAISALLGDTIYNFGELLLHPVLTSLESSPYAYLSNLLFAFNSGDIGRFESLVPHLSSEPILAENQPFLRQKICLMALIEGVFKRASTDRTLSFETIAQETRLPVGEVEHLVMKALSLKLIRGTLDQDAQMAHITWVQPRVLDKRQIEALSKRLNEWCARVQDISEFVKGQTPELFITA